MNRRLGLYKALVYAFGNYDLRFPDTVNSIWESMQEKGLEVIPADGYAQMILERIVEEKGDSVPNLVQEILNRRFKDLDPDIRPEYKEGHNIKVAYWCSEGKVYDKTYGLLYSGYWSDKEGHQVELLGGV